MSIKYNISFKDCQTVNINVNGFPFISRNNYSVASSKSGQAEVKAEVKAEFDSLIGWDIAEEVEEDINSDDLPYRQNKIKTAPLERVYLNRSEIERAEQVHNCSTYLEFSLEKDKTIDKKKLHRINSCKRRLCPACMYRKSLKHFANMRRITTEVERQYMKSGHHIRYIFLTLTMENVCGDDLSAAVTKLLKGFENFRRKRIGGENKYLGDIFFGMARSLEITVDRAEFITSAMYERKKEYYNARGLNKGDKNPNYLMFHPHIHIIACTTYEIYGKDKIYIDNFKLSQMWQECLKVDYMPITDIRPFKAKHARTAGKELAEIAKYTVKPSDYLTGDIEEDSTVIGYLDKALFNRRLVAYTGIFKEIYKQLKLDDKIERGENTIDEDAVLIRYFWDFAKVLYYRDKEYCLKGD